MLIDGGHGVHGEPLDGAAATFFLRGLQTLTSLRERSGLGLGSVVRGERAESRRWSGGP